MIDSLKSELSKKDSAHLMALLASHPEVLEETDENGSSGFMLIAYRGLESVFNKAIDLKQSFSFHEAIVAGKESTFQELLKANNSLANSHSKDGFTPLSLAAFFDQTSIAIMLLENGADPNLQATNPSKVNALHSAVAKENYELCEKLIAFGVDVNTTQMSNVTALHSATHRGNLEIVQLLVEHGAEIEIKMENGDTAISIAERESHQEVLKFLLNR